jgi:hypothetical protein
MRFRAVICCCTAVLLPQLALAARPPGEVGALQAVYDFCTNVDPTERKDFDKEADALFRGLSPAQVAALRQTAEYRRGYRTLAGVLPDLRGNDAVLACRAISRGSEPSDGAEERRDR